MGSIGRQHKLAMFVVYAALRVCPDVTSPVFFCVIFSTHNITLACVFINTINLLVTRNRLHLQV